ncbi:cytidine deaminase [Oxobacter pfennigii]|uniref:Cytidine deaminase n=1 Tax=Oxobacter pfennigii TaxID=36849 RepID=A0A0P8W7U4_9CLOT|nr:cytidine deaminase [Oxobacter pfennigii]KPU44108.1 cytidine deaminase [Oxobacter pfennigii]
MMIDARELINYAIIAKGKAYAPYSKFRVGAAVLAKGGTIYSGCNVENASFGATNCAERTAIFKAVSEGAKDFIAIAVNSDSENFTYPCGICRQVIAEFSAGMKVYVSNRKGEYKEYTINELLPGAFTGEDMK